MKLDGSIWATKKWPTLTTDLVMAGITEERPFLRFDEKQNFFSKKKTQKTLKDWFGMMIWKKGTFFFAQFCPVVARTGFWLRSGCYFLGPKICILAWKSLFLYRDPVFCQRGVRNPQRWFRLTPSDLLCGFSFPSYVRFRERNMAHAQKSLPPPHSEGTICLVRFPNPLFLEVQISTCQFGNPTTAQIKITWSLFVSGIYQQDCRI